MLSICITIKNRSKVPFKGGNLDLFPNCIESLAKSITLDDDIELVIADWESTDRPIKEWIEDKIKHIPITIITIKADGFSIGKGRNIAAQHAQGDILFFLDAEMIVSRDVLINGMKCIKPKFPTIYYQTMHGLNDYKIYNGGGNLFITPELFNKVGKWPEYWNWGFEDVDFVNNLKKITEIEIIPERLYHQWHPQEHEWKDQYGSNDPELKQFIDNRKAFHQGNITKEVDFIKNFNKILINNDPNTTHSKLNDPVKGKVTYYNT